MSKLDGAMQRRVLVVDDDVLQLRSIERMARREPRIQLTTTTSPIEALLLVASTRPEVVILDVFMPGMNGLEVCRQLKANSQTCDLTVVLASATMNPTLAEEARLAGATHVVQKPVSLELVFEDLDREPTEALEPVERTAQVRGSDLLVSMLEDAGVDQVFGLPGGAISPIHDALLDSRIRTITTRHESGAMFAAAGYAHATGKLAVVAVTSGPGALNAMTGLASAWCDGLPVLLLVGEVPRAAHGKGVLQDGSAHGLHLVEMARHVTKMSAEIPRASALPHVVRRAIATAMSGKKGPVMLTLPLDVTTALVTPPRVGGAISIGETLAPEILDELVTILRTSHRPLILAGSGLRSSSAPERLLRVAEALSCPVATTPKGKGVFPEDHPLALGVLGMGGHPSARTYLETNPDVVMVIGSSLGDIATDNFSIQLQAKTLIHVDIDARQIGKSYEPTHAVVASAAELLGGLAERLVGTKRRRSLQAILANRGVERLALEASVTPQRIASHDAIREIQRALPSDTIFTVDSGEHFLFAVQYLETALPDAFLVMTGLGSMGQSIGAAIGAQLAHRHRSVAAICGDGCFAMNAFEIATAVAERLPIRVFVFNDGVLGMVEKGHQKVYGRRAEYPTGPTGPLDVCAIARGLGATAILVDGTGQLAVAERLLAHHRGPVVVDVRIDPAIVMRGKDRVSAMTPTGGMNLPLPAPRPAIQRLGN